LARLGVGYASPFWDFRVVESVLSSRTEDVAPLESPKPLLAKAFLGEWDASRVKTSFFPYYARLADAATRLLDEQKTDGLRSAKVGIIRADKWEDGSAEAWPVEVLRLLAIELWLEYEDLDKDSTHD
jgi:hypothetical protein